MQDDTKLTVRLCLGFTFPAQVIFSHFRRERPGKYHFEERWDKQGAPLSPELIWDKKPEVYYVFNDRDYIDAGLDVLLGDLENYLNCEILCSVSSARRETIDFCIRHKNETTYLTHINIINRSYTLPAIDFFRSELDKLQEKLFNIGLKPDAPEVFIHY